ncbi:DNA N-6-adenine-methyltransferase (Dam) [compost metagenome]
MASEKMAVHFSSETDLWATPKEFFDKLNAEFSFELDVCATPDNAKCDKFYTVHDNGLLQRWGGVCWMNPPYGRAIGEWVKKAYESAQDGATVVCLVPARTDTRWWHDYCMKGEIRFVRGRLKFGTAKENAPFPNAVVIFRSGVKEDGRQLTLF